MLFNENAGTQVRFLSRIPFRSKFLTSDLPPLSIDFMTDLSVFVFTLRLQTSQHGPGGKVLHLSPQNI